MKNVVIFDYDGVIRFLDTIKVDEILREYNFSHDDFFLKVWDESVFDLITGKLDRSSWWKGLQNKHDELKQFDEQFLWDDIFGHNYFNDELLEFVTELKSNREEITLVILSNADLRSTEEIEIEMEEYPFDYIMSSGRFGVAKPEIEIFRLVLEKIRAMPSDCLFFDDSLKNVEAAQTLGITSVFVSNERDENFVQSIIERELDLGSNY